LNKCLTLFSKHFVFVLHYNYFFLPYFYRDNTGDLNTIIGALYGSVFFVGVNNCQTVQPVVAVERTVFYRERAAGMYSALPYAIAQVKGWIYFLDNYKTYYILYLLLIISSIVVSFAGYFRNTISICSNYIFLIHSVCYGEL